MGKANPKREIATTEDQGQEQPEAARIELPPKVGPGQAFIIEMFAEKSVGERRRVVNTGEHPLLLAYYRGQLVSKYPATVPEADRITEDQRLEAGQEYRGKFEAMGRSGRDSTDFEVSGRGGSRTPWAQTQADAIMWLKRIEEKMHPRDRIIVRKFCGEGWSMVGALRHASIIFHPNSAAYRVREALDDLVIAVAGRRFIPTPKIDN